MIFGTFMVLAEVGGHATTFFTSFLLDDEASEVTADSRCYEIRADSLCF